MTTTPRRISELSKIKSLTAAVCVFAVLACVQEVSAPVTKRADSSPLLAKATATSDMSVSSAVPDSATQDTTLDVVVNGSGFVQGTIATWRLAGVADSTQVRTNSTRYVSSRQLVANITISATATIAKWDVAVAASGKKGGIGTEMFAIKVKPSTDTNSRLNYVLLNQMDVAPSGSTANIQPAGIVGDGRLRDGSSANGGDSEYQSRFCGSTGSVVTMPKANGDPGSGDLVMQPGNGNLVCGEKRFMVATLDGVAVQFDPSTRVPAVYKLGLGETQITIATMAVSFTNCNYLQFDPAYGGSNVILTRLDSGVGPRKWRLQSKSPHMAACSVLYPGKPGSKATGKTYYLPFAFIVTEVPYPFPTYP